LADEQTRRIVRNMAVQGWDDSVQLVQTAHRLKLAEFWGIPEGSRILEIGCGQGDTTAVLADAVGENGRVEAVDIASPDYGSPITLGEARDRLLASEFGGRIGMTFGTDVLSEHVRYPERSFDFVVLSHSSWYMSSREQLVAILSRARGWGRGLLFAEWDPEVRQAEQFAHYAAVLLQAQSQCYAADESSNVRTLFAPPDIREALASAGWEIEEERSVYSPELQDGKWEVGKVLEEFEAGWEALERSDMPAKLRELLRSQFFLLRETARRGEIKPLSVYALRAR